MKKLLLLLIAFVAANSYAQATLVLDINKGNNSSSPGDKIVFNNQAYFPANDGIHGNELWKTDGTEAGTMLFKEFVSGEESGIPFNFEAKVALNSLFFFTNDESANFALWKTDGTEAGTEKIKTFAGSQPYLHDEISGVLIFSANNQLWKTDGTEAGTVKLANYPVFGGSRFIKSGNEIYFSGEASFSIGQELYKTDGMTVSLVKNIYPSSNKDSYPNNFATLNGTVYFSATNGTNGFELWKSNGTETGTEMVKDINPGSGNSFSTNTPIKVYNNELFFTYGTKLWKSDGTTAGTIELLELESNPKAIVIFNSKIHVFTYSNAFWVSDGTVDGSEKIETTTSEFFHNNEYAVVGNQLFFQANNEAGYEIWKTDGTAIGSGLVKDIHPEFDDNNIEGIIDLNGKALFTASDGNWLGKELYISDGTEAGTQLLKDINTQGNRGSSPQNYFQFGNKILLSADNGEYGREPWIIENGTATLLKDINSGTLYSNPSNFLELNGLVYFYATSAEKGKELWKTDGTEAGTVLVKDINPNAESGISSNYLVTLNGKLYFYAFDPVNGSELWESDGTEAGTILVKDINTGDASSIRSGELYVFKNKIYFNATDSSNDYELWTSDGTEAGTILFYDANASGSSSPDNFIEFKDGLHFRANSSSGSRMYKTDGTNTFSVTDKGYSNMTVSGEYLYFVSTYNNGGELWATQNGVTVYQVKDIKPGTGGRNGSFPNYLTDLNGTLYFVANDGTNGNELWKSDGTASGTTLVKNIIDGSDSSYISEIVNFAGTLIFGAGNNNQNKELWKSDGTETGTVLLQDINPSTEQYGNGSNPNNFFSSGDVLYFAASDGVTGNEPWMLEESTLSLEEETLNQFAKVSVYPNPTSDILNIKVDNQQIKSIKIFNVLGKQVMYSSIKNNTIDTSHLPKGIYVLQVKTDVSTFSRKIIKQ